jgi:hypothetical protein
MHPPSNIDSSKKGTTEALAHTSANPATSVQLSDTSFSVCSKPSPDSLAFNSIGQMLCGSALETVVVSPDPPISRGKIHNQQISGDSLVPFERRLGPPANHIRHPSPSLVPTFAWPVPPSLDQPLADSTGASQITVSPGAPVDLNVFDWNSIPNPLVETTISMST